MPFVEFKFSVKMFALIIQGHLKCSFNSVCVCVCSFTSCSSLHVCSSQINIGQLLFTDETPLAKKAAP